MFHAPLTPDLKFESNFLLVIRGQNFNAIILSMKKPLLLTSQDPILETINFQTYRSAEERRIEQFLPKDDEPQSIKIATPWGAELTAKKGDYLVGDPNRPEDRWPVDPEIFKNSYNIVRPGFGVKASITRLVPLIDITGGDEDCQVTIETLEGPTTVRAGDFFLARGIKGEIWPIPKQKVLKSLVRTD
jgi:hypothetical protein